MVRHMARYVTTIESALPQADAFAYMADFANARLWDRRPHNQSTVQDRSDGSSQPKT